MPPEYESLICKRCGAVAAYIDYDALLILCWVLCAACYDQQKRMG